MGAYQCLQCGALEEFDENMHSKDCCGKQELFRVNDMPGEILKLRAALAQQGRDAEDAKRYRWLRDASMSERNRLEHYASHAMDTAIDAAIAAARGE